MLQSIGKVAVAFDLCVLFGLFLFVVCPLLIAVPLAKLERRKPVIVSIVMVLVTFVLVEAVVTLYGWLYHRLTAG